MRCSSMSSRVSRCAWLTLAVALIASCSGRAPSEGDQAPRAMPSGIAPAAPNAVGLGRAVRGKGRTPVRKHAPPTPEVDPFDPMLPDAGAIPPGPTQL